MPDQLTELLLSASTCSGEAIRFNSNRGYLARALQLGFRELSVFSNASPTQCRDENRMFLWALLEPEAALKPTENAVRIEPQASKAAPKPITQERPTFKHSLTAVVSECFFLVLTIKREHRQRIERAADVQQLTRTPVR